MRNYDEGFDLNTFIAWIITYVVGAASTVAVLFLLLYLPVPNIILKLVGPILMGYIVIFPQHVFLGSWFHGCSLWDPAQHQWVYKEDWFDRSAWLGFVCGIVLGGILLAVYILLERTAKSSYNILCSGIVFIACACIWWFIQRVTDWDIAMRWSYVTLLATFVGFLSAGVSGFIMSYVDTPLNVGSVAVSGASFGLGYACVTGSLLRWVTQAPGYNR